jgi:hypothetical protein
MAPGRKPCHADADVMNAHGGTLAESGRAALEEMRQRGEDNRTPWLFV